MPVADLTVNFGSMFSGKTEETIRQVRRKKIAGKKIQVFKPRIDNRYSDKEIVTHYGDAIECEIVNDSLELYKRIRKDTDVIAIDEAQFFDEGLFDVIRGAKRYDGIEVIVSGLDMWANGAPIPLMANLAAIADHVHKFKAVCADTGRDAYLSYCLIQKTGDVLVGGSESYIALSEEAYLKREYEKQVKAHVVE